MIGWVLPSFPAATVKNLASKVVPLSEVHGKGLFPDPTTSAPYVMIVDDEEVIADSLALILRQAGYLASALYDAGSALRLAELAPPEVLITDVCMPEMNGLELAIAIRGSIPDCQILLFSGQAETRDLVAKAERSGQEFELLAKPIHPDDLLKKVREMGNFAGRDKSL